MKNTIIYLIIICLFYSCNGPKCYDYKTVLEVQPFHATRINIKYISQCGDTIATSEHWSATIKAENITFNVSDYLNGKLKYGKIK